MPFDELIDYETGDLSQWSAGGGGNGVADGAAYPSIVSGRLTAVTSYTPPTGPVVTPAAGPTTTAMGKITLNPPLPGQSSDRAEGVRWTTWDQYDGLTKFFHMSLYLPSAFNWSSSWSADATNSHFNPVIAQPLGTFFFTTCLLNLNPPGWQGMGAPSVSMFACGGLVTPGVSTEHRLAMNPSAGNGYDTFLTPTAAAAGGGAQRFVQLIGQTPNGNRPLTTNTHHEIIVEYGGLNTNGHKPNGSPLLGYYRAYHRTRGSGLGWFQTFQTTAIYKNQVFYPGGGYPEHGTWSFTHNIGGYCYGLPQSITYLHDQIGICDTLAEAQSKFADESGGGGGGGGGAPPGTPTSGSVSGSRVTAVG